MRNTPGHTSGPQASTAPPQSPSTTQAEVPEERPLSTHSSITAREPRRIKKAAQVFTVHLVLFYIALSLVYWILLCRMTYKPYGQKSYFEAVPYSSFREGQMIKKFQTNERQMRAMLIIKSIATALIIPVTGYVCAEAAMSYLQGNAIRSRLTLRQSMVVANQHWINPLVWVHAGSLMLYIGFSLMILGKIRYYIDLDLDFNSHRRTHANSAERVYTTRDIPSGDIRYA